MSSKKYVIDHIFESIDIIESQVSDVSQGDFNNNIMLQDCIMRRIQLIGEGVRKLTLDYPELREIEVIPWQDIIGMRNILVHNYLGIDLDMVWEVAHDDLKDLRDKINENLDIILGDIE
ncbi:hypothetical protein COB57_00880 [Candidatus Peregrinibacteria bacterium]|nr:MAG: hypothetical protein COB57_00880 [Candidatus Peregrinibacteria bacterium]